MAGLLDLRRLDADALRDLLRAPTPSPEKYVHWSVRALGLMRIAEEKLWAVYGATSLRAWAADEMDLGSSDVSLFLDLAQMMLENQSAIPLDGWADLSWPKAKLLRKIARLGDLPRWYRSALELSAGKLGDAIDRALGREVWTEFRCAIPQALTEPIRQALELALSQARGEPFPDPDRVEDRDTKFRCLEVIVVHFLNTYRSAPAEA